MNSTDRNKARKARQQARKAVSAAVTARKATRARHEAYHAEHEPNIVSVKSQQPDDRPKPLFASGSWVTVPPQVLYTARANVNLGYVDSITARCPNSRKDLAPASKR